jgi:hypothetical protein
MNLGNGYGMIDLLRYLAEDLRLVDFQDASYIYLLDQDNKMVDYPNRDMVNALFACDYLKMENKEDRDGRKFIEYKLSEKGKTLYNTREGRPAHAGEHFWIIKFKRDGQLRVFIDMSISAPNLSALIDESWKSGNEETWIPVDRIVITCHPPHYVSARELLKDID